MNRDCDYIISINFVTFLILIKLQKHEEANKYMLINKKMIECILQEDLIKLDKGSLSVILESTN